MKMCKIIVLLNEQKPSLSCPQKDIGNFKSNKSRNF